MDLHDIKRSLQQQNGTSSLFPLDKQLRITQAKGHEIIALITGNVENVEGGIAKLPTGLSSRVPWHVFSFSLRWRKKHLFC